MSDDYIGRRPVLKALGSGSVAGLAGCVDDVDDILNGDDADHQKDDGVDDDSTPTEENDDESYSDDSGEELDFEEPVGTLLESDGENEIQVIELQHGEQKNITLDIETDTEDTEYSLYIDRATENITLETGETTPEDTETIEKTLDYHEILENTEPGQNTLTLQLKTENPETQEQITTTTETPLQIQDPVQAWEQLKNESQEERQITYQLMHPDSRTHRFIAYDTIQELQSSTESDPWHPWIEEVYMPESNSINLISRVIQFLDYEIHVYLLEGIDLEDYEEGEISGEKREGKFYVHDGNSDAIFHRDGLLAYERGGGFSDLEEFYDFLESGSPQDRPWTDTEMYEELVPVSLAHGRPAEGSNFQRRTLTDISRDEGADRMYDEDTPTMKYVDIIHLDKESYLEGEPKLVEEVYIHRDKQWIKIRDGIERNIDDIV